MITLLASEYLVVALAAAAAVVALHLLARRRPPPAILPTARFVPSSAVRAESRIVRLQDVALLVVRVLALLLAGLALARPVVVAPRRGVARVIVMDLSRSVAHAAEVGDSARGRAQGADAVVLIRVDSVARLTTDRALLPALEGDARSATSAASPLTTEVTALQRAEVRGSVTAGLLLAFREARRLTQRYDAVDLVMVSPFARESWDAATLSVRAAWPRPISVVSVAPREAGSSPPAPRDWRLPSTSDPVGAAFALAGHRGTSQKLRVIRGGASSDDSLWARDGGVVVVWPTAPPGGQVDAVGLIAWTGGAVAGPLTRTPNAERDGVVMARWVDGTPAATESPMGRGCVRSVDVLPANAGDVVLRPAFVQLARRLGAPCGAFDWTPVEADLLRQLAGEGDISARDVPEASALPDAAKAGQSGGVTARSASGPDLTVESSARHSALVRWLLAFVAVGLAIEWWIRQRARRAVTLDVPAVDADAVEGA